MAQGWRFDTGSGKDVSLYVHIPFCASRCRYCDFASNVAGQSAMERYVSCLMREMDQWAPAMEGRRVSTVFFGGGTPGLLPTELMDWLAAGIRRRFDCRADAEWTLESNPETTDLERAQKWRSMGFNRLSLGLQAAQPALLAMLGRRADAERLLKAAGEARQAGLDNLNVDLMASLPGQRMEDLLESVEVAIRAGANHISLYALVVHEDTPLGRDIGSGVLAQPGEDEDRDMFEAACRRLEAEGYGRYEISNFARPGRESRHNLVYWRRGDYLGMGASAASCDGGRRWCNVPGLEDYCRRMETDALPWNEVEMLSEADKAFETLMLGLRLTRGIDRAAFEKSFGYDCVARFRPLLARWTRAGLARLTGERLMLTAAGLDVQNALLVELMEAMGL